MVLKYSFKYLSNDQTLAKFLDYACKQFDCEYKIFQDLDYVYLFVDANEDILEEFSNNLSLYIPMSIFYYDIKIDFSENMPKKDSILLDEKKAISFCPKCLKEAEDITNSNYYNIFTSCDICKCSSREKLLFDGKKVKSNKKLFEQLASLINDNKKIKIKTLSGTFVFSKLNDLQNTTNLLVSNLVNISKLVVQNKTEIVSLVSIEKPSIDFKINDIYKMKNNTQKSFVNIRFANDLILYFLSQELQKFDIDFLSIENEETKYDNFLDFTSKEENEELLDIPKIKCLENKKIILESKSYAKSLDKIYNKFEEKNKGHFMTVMVENNLFQKTVLNFYISTKDDDGISLYSDKFDGVVDMKKQFYIPKTIKEIFEEIQKDEIANKLINNYKDKFPDDYEKAINTDITHLDKNSFYNYWEIAKIILNFKEDILINASNCLLEKGPRIDYKFKENDKLQNREFNYTKLIQSALSFKLAGVDEVTISLGYIESLCHFIGNEIDLINSSYELDAISLCGDMFTYDIFNKLVEKSITKNFKLYYNREFVIQK